MAMQKMEDFERQSGFGCILTLRSFGGILNILYLLVMMRKRIMNLRKEMLEQRKIMRISKIPSALKRKICEKIDDVNGLVRSWSNCNRDRY